MSTADTSLTSALPVEWSDAESKNEPKYCDDEFTDEDSTNDVTNESQIEEMSQKCNQSISIVRQVSVNT
jgi:hypothetical protein